MEQHTPATEFTFRRAFCLGNHSGGLTLEIRTTPHKLFFRGVLCHPNDQFNRKVGFKLLQEATWHSIGIDSVSFAGMRSQYKSFMHLTNIALCLLVVNVGRRYLLDQHPTDKSGVFREVLHNVDQMIGQLCDAELQHKSTLAYHEAAVEYAMSKRVGGHPETA